MLLTLSRLHTSMRKVAYIFLELVQSLLLKTKQHTGKYIEWVSFLLLLKFIAWIGLEFLKSRIQNNKFNWCSPKVPVTFSQSSLQFSLLLFRNFHSTCYRQERSFRVENFQLFFLNPLVPKYARLRLFFAIQMIILFQTVCHVIVSLDYVS